MEAPISEEHDWRHGGLGGKGPMFLCGAAELQEADVQNFAHRLPCLLGARCAEYSIDIAR